MFSLRILMAAVGVTLILLRLGEAAACKRTPQDNPGCPFNLLESHAYSCQVTTFTSQQFSFYVRPGSNFGNLFLTVRKRALFFPSGSSNFEIGRDLLPSPDKWYLIKFSHDTNKSYFLHIDGRLVWAKTLIVSKTSSVVFSLRGSLYFASQCNPVDAVLDSLASTPGSLELANASLEIRNSDTYNDNLLVNIIIISSGSAIAFVVIMSILAVLLIKFSRKRRSDADGERSRNTNCNTVEASIHVNKRNTNQVAARNSSGNDYITNTPRTPTAGSAWSEDFPKGTSNVTEEPIYEEVEQLYEELDENFSIRVHI